MSINILDELKNDFLIYSQEVNTNRAFPNAKDGLKPSQRAALYTMFRKGFTADKPHVKSAKITGAIIGELWPHGDSSAYESIVRMSQDWINNIPEVDWHGANGSLLGGPEAASSRYTECRLSKAAEEGFFSNIKKDVVDFIPNFSEDDEWPSVFPAIFPRLFVNGSQGIGYTIAQEWEPGNLNEFTTKVKQYISKKKITLNDIYPDYPTGGVIVNKSAISEIYKTGKGSVILRGKINVIGKYINITELPYQTYAEPFIQKVKDLVNAGTLSGIDDICNKSDDDGLLIEIECSANPQIVLNKLYKLTDLQVTFSANQMAIVDNTPQLISLQDYIKIYVQHNIDCIIKEYQYDKNKALNRLEIVEGLLRALTIIDEIIATIKKAKSSELAKQDLVKKFNFTLNQAKAIIDMRLGKLANLEQKQLLDEQKELTKLIAKCDALLDSEKAQEKEFINRLEIFTEKYGWDRHTEVIDVDLEAEKQQLKNQKIEEKFIILLTTDNKIKKIPVDQFKINKLSNKDIKYIEAGKKDRFVLISEDGQMYKQDVKNLDICGQSSAGTLLENKIVNIFKGDETEPYLIFLTENGLIKKIESKAVFELSKLSGAPVMKVNDGDNIIYCELVSDEKILIVKYENKEKKLMIKDFLPKGRLAGGVVAIKLKKNAKINFEDIIK